MIGRFRILSCRTARWWGVAGALCFLFTFAPCRWPIPVYSGVALNNYVGGINREKGGHKYCVGCEG